MFNIILAVVKNSLHDIDIFLVTLELLSLFLNETHFVFVEHCLIDVYDFIGRWM